MFVWQATYDHDMACLLESIKAKEASRVKLIQELEQLKIVHRLDVKAMDDLRNERDALKSELEEIEITSTDCRSDEGVTVGLVDALIAIGRILNKRDISGLAAQEALADFRDDEDQLEIFDKAYRAKRVIV